MTQMKKYTKAELQDMAIRSIIDSISDEELLDWTMNWFYKDSVYVSEWTDWCGQHDHFSEELDLTIVPIFKRYSQRFRTGPYLVEEYSAIDPDAEKDNFEDGNKIGF